MTSSQTSRHTQHLGTDAQIFQLQHAADITSHHLIILYASTVGNWWGESRERASCSASGSSTRHNRPIWGQMKSETWIKQPSLFFQWLLTFQQPHLLSHIIRPIQSWVQQSWCWTLSTHCHVPSPYFSKARSFTLGSSWLALFSSTSTSIWCFAMTSMSCHWLMLSLMGQLSWLNNNH